MSEKDIERWHDAVTPFSKAPQPWKLGSGGSWDMLEVQPIHDDMLAELAQRYYYAGTPWNCRSMPLSASDREYMYLLYSCMQGLVARMRQAERKAADAAAKVEDLRAALKWYADGEHFDRCDASAWDTVSGEPQNWWCDEAGTGMVEDGTLARKVLAGELTGAQLHAMDDEDDGPQNDVQAAFGGLVQTPQG